MATKKSTKSSQKTAKPKTVAKKPVQNSKKPTKTCHKPGKTEAHHLCFGVMMIGVGFVVFLSLVLGLAFYLAKINLMTDAERFSAEYSEVEKDNLFVYQTGEEVIEILEHGTGVVFLGFPQCPWCQAYAPMLNSLAKEAGIEKIYYHNTYDDWQNDTKEYHKLTELLGSNLQYDEAGNRHLYVPDAVFVKDGVIIGNDFETSKDTADAKTPEEYWTDERVEAFNSRISSFLSQLK